jgi:fibronectin type 3 domain-containing protein/predicted esterase
MKFFTSIVRIFLVALTVFTVQSVSGQSVLDPADPTVTYNSATPPTQPADGTIGKWVRTRRVSWNSDSYKAYIYRGNAFRLKFPKTYNPTANDGKKYPMFIFWHGLGEAGPITDNEYSLFHGGDVWAAAVDNGSFDGYVMVMQNTSGYFSNSQYTQMTELMNYMVTNNKLDPFHCVDNGLSAGGQATWDALIANPTYFNAGIPMSNSSTLYMTTAIANTIKFSPLWLFQGGKDVAPDPYSTHQMRDYFLAAGANLRYTEYPNDGHGTWDDAWREPDFWPFVSRVYGSNPWALTGQTAFCPGTSINATIGVAPGFAAYEWSKDGVVIPGATSNSYQATAVGSYTARVKRGTIWSDPSHTPLVISIKQPTVTPPITIAPLTSNVIPALDTSHGVTLQLPAGYASYVWQQSGSSTTLSTTNTLYTTTPGNYVAKVTEQFGCSSSFGAPYTVVAANGPNKPSAAAGLGVTVLGLTSLRLDWTVNPSQQYPQTAFEVYQGTAAGGPYKLIAILPANANSYTNNGLNAGIRYYYVVRAVNGTSAAPASNEASASTIPDNQAPTPPGNLTITGTSRSSIGLKWDASTDNVGVVKYDIYVNGVKNNTTTATNFTVYDLQNAVNYNIVVTAKDFAGNISPFSNQVTSQALAQGYTWKFYTFTANYSAIPNLNTLPVVLAGTSPGIDLSTRTQDINFAYLYEGYIHITQAGNYRFRTNSDDGSRLWVGSLNQTTSAYKFGTTSQVNNDGLHGGQDASSSSINLQVGVYPIAIAYYNQGGGFGLTVSWATPASGLNNYSIIPASALTDAVNPGGSAPAAPSNLVATANAYNKITLNWTDNSNNETGYEVYRTTDSLGNGLAIIARVPAGSTSYKDSGLLNATTKYYYRVRAIGQYGNSAFDNAGPGIGYSYYEASGLSALPDFNSLVPVKTGAVSSIGTGMENRATDFQLKFAGNITLPSTTIYTFYTSSDDGSALYIDGFDAAHQVVNNNFLQGMTERSGTKLLTAGVHSLYVTFFQGGGGYGLNASISAVGLSKRLIPGSMLGVSLASATTLALPAAPLAPTVLVAHGTSTPTSVTLSWQDNATTETNYQVYRSANDNTNYLLLTTLAANSISYKDSGLFANATYYYKVRALNTGGNSAYSNEDSAHTANHLPVLKAIATQYMRFGTQLVLNLTATDQDPETLTLSSSGAPSFGVFTPTGSGTGTLTFNPSTTDQGTYDNISVTVTDQHGGIVTQTFSLTVNSNYNPAITRPVANVTMNEKATTTVNLAATDLNATDALAWTFTGLPAFATPTSNGGSAQVSLAPGYADAGTYAVQANVNDGNNGFDTLTFTITVLPVTPPSPKVYVHFSDGSAGTVAAAPWNNTATTPAQGKVFTNLKDQSGAISGLTFTITTPWQSLSFGDGTNTYGQSTGNNSGVYPDAVLGSAWYTDGTPQTIKISGMDPSSVYNFTFFGSRGFVTDDRTSTYSVGGNTVTLQTANNTANTVSINGVTPAADGTLNMTLANSAASTYGYMNSVVIQKLFDDHTAPAKPRSISAQFVTNDHVNLTWVAAAYNASAYQVYRSATLSGPYTLLNPGATDPAQQVYNDSTISQNNTYYYYVTATNVYGTSPSSDTATMAVPNLPPVLSPVSDATVGAGQSATVNLTATDADAITLSATGLPAFAVFTDNGNGTGKIVLNPTASQIGNYSGIVVKATDSYGASSTRTFNISVSFANLRNVDIQFNDGSAGSPAQGAPWNSMNAAPNAGAGLTNLKDDQGTSTGFGVSLVDTWTGSNNVGATTGNNTGVYPDKVLASLYYDQSLAPRHINLTGLAAIAKYNVIFYAGRAGTTDNRTTHYKIGNQEVQLNASSNSTQTVQINNVSPDANGNIAITLSNDAGSFFTYINAIQLQYSYDTTFYAPTGLTGTGLSTSSVRLDWASNSPAITTGFEIWRSTTPTGTFTQIATVAGGVNTYTNTGLAANSAFFYQVRAVAGTRKSAFSAVAGGSTVAYTVNLQFNDGAQLLAQGGTWNSTNTLITPGFVLPNMMNTSGQRTGINMGVLSPFTGYGIVGATTGNNSGIFPDNVMKGLFYVNFGDTARIYVDNLSLTTTYNFNFFGSRITPPTSVICTYAIGNQFVTLDATNNTSKTVSITGVKPDSTGRIVITLYNSTEGRAYLNAMTIDAVPSAFQGIPQNPVATAIPRGLATTATSNRFGDSTQTAGFTGATKVSAFPNPFMDALMLNLQLSKPVAKLLVSVVDQSGRAIFKQELANLPQGTSVQKLGLPGASIPAGSYFILLQGLPEGQKYLQVIKTK